MGTMLDLFLSSVFDDIGGWGLFQAVLKCLPTKYMLDVCISREMKLVLVAYT